MDTLMGIFEYVLYKNVRLDKTSAGPILYATWRVGAYSNTQSLSIRAPAISVNTLFAI
jgi:hypothetical protein